MIIMGIDQSYTSTGIVILDDEFVLHKELIKTPKEEDIFKRAHNIAEKIKEVADFFDPAVIQIEGLAFGIRGNATRDLGGLQFVIMSNLKYGIGKNYNVNIIAPLSLKKFATGNGRAKKEDMIEHLPNIVLADFLETGVKKTTGLADLADAYWLAKFKKETK